MVSEVNRRVFNLINEATFNYKKKEKKIKEIEEEEKEAIRNNFIEEAEKRLDKRYEENKNRAKLDQSLTLLDIKTEKFINTNGFKYYIIARTRQNWQETRKKNKGENKNE